MYDVSILNNADNYTYFLRYFHEYDQFSSVGEHQYRYFNANDDIGLKKIGERYNFSKIIKGKENFNSVLKLMEWTFNHIIHLEEASYEGVLYTLDILEYSQTKKVSLNCLCFATVLTEILLSLGYQARKVYCLSCDVLPRENHVVVEVYVAELKKWVFLDPSISGYIKNDEGIPLSIYEIREKLVKNERINVCYYNRFRNSFIVSTESYFKEEDYIAYLCKDFFRFLICSNQHSGLVKMDDTYRMLLPKGYLEPNISVSNYAGHQCCARVTNNALEFWR